jgi:hypothetical protein
MELVLHVGPHATKVDPVEQVEPSGALVGRVGRGTLDTGAVLMRRPSGQNLLTVVDTMAATSASSETSQRTASA